MFVMHLSYHENDIAPNALTTKNSSINQQTVNLTVLLISPNKQ